MVSRQTRQAALPAFEVDRRGLAQILERRGKGFVLLELIQNALDEDVRRVTVTLEPVKGRSLARVRVEDESPVGFRTPESYELMFVPVNQPPRVVRGIDLLRETPATSQIVAHELWEASWNGCGGVPFPL